MVTLIGKLYIVFRPPGSGRNLAKNGPETGSDGAGRGLKMLLESVAPSHLNISPWGATECPFMPDFGPQGGPYFDVKK